MALIALIGAALLAAQPTDSPQIDVNIAISPCDEIMLGDPVFLRVSVKNTGDGVARIPLHFALSISTLRVEVLQSSGDYTYNARGDYGSGAVEASELAPGVTRIVAYEIVEMPPAHDLEHDFWRDMRIVAWASMSAPGEPARYFELVFDTVQRLPEKLYEFEDYRAHQLDQYAASHPGFKEYVERRQESDQAK